MIKPIVKLQEYQLHDRHALISEVRRQMRLCNFPLEEIWEFEVRALQPDLSPLTEARRYVTLEGVPND